MLTRETTTSVFHLLPRSLNTWIHVLNETTSNFKATKTTLAQLKTISAPRILQILGLRFTVPKKKCLTKSRVTQMAPSQWYTSPLLASKLPPPRSKGSWWVPPLEALPCRPHTPHLRVLYPGKVEDATATLSWPCAWCMCPFDVQIFSSSNQVKTITLQGTNIFCWQKEKSSWYVDSQEGI